MLEGYTNMKCNILFLNPFYQMDPKRRGWLLPGCLHFWCRFWPKPWALWLDQVQGHGSAAQEDRREPAEILVWLHRHVQAGVSPAT